MTMPVKVADPFPATVICGWCDGEGALTTGELCPECHGTGKVVAQPMPREELAAATGCLIGLGISVAFFWAPLVWRLLR